MCLLVLQEKHSISLRSKSPENDQAREFTLYRQVGMNQRELTTLVRAQACKRSVREFNVAAWCTLWRECDLYADYLQI